MDPLAELPGCRSPDVLAYALVFFLLALGWGGRSAWEASDPRIEVWAAWHEAAGPLPKDPWGVPFRDDQNGIRSAGPNGEFEDDLERSDDLLVPRVPTSELGLYRVLGWLPWLAAIVLALGWEGYRWLRKPSEGLKAELPLALVGGGVCAASCFAGLTILVGEERAAREFLRKAGEGLIVPPALALAGSIGVCAALAILAIRLRALPKAELTGSVEGE